jgi:hypothetical protein
MSRTILASAIACMSATVFAAPPALSDTMETAQAGVDQIDQVDFNRHIRPILSDNCYYCHGPDKEQREADLRLDIREVAIEAFAFVPGDTEDGELLHRIFSDDPEEMMPAPKSNKELSNKEKLLLKRWIAEGAVYQSHWAYAPIERPTQPAIDAIVEKQLSDRNLKPSPEAAKATLIRRVSLDLIGLPPSPKEVAAFLKDKSPRAYERLVDRLLSSRHYGEKMAIHWLDAVRYADTVGYHGDQERDATPYRDYVIQSFNKNKPYDQFTIEQIAGDLLPDPSIEQLVAASYNRLNQISREGGIQDKEYLKKYQSERVRTTATNWLGSTMACCECHDHKFDPFTTKDFYSMAAFFSDILEKGAYTGNGAYQESIDAYLTNSERHEGWFGPEVAVPNYVFHENAKSVEQIIREKENTLAKGSSKARKEYQTWLAMQRELAKRDFPEYSSFDYTDEHHETTIAEAIDLCSYPWSLDETAALDFEARIVGGGGRGSLGIELTYETNGQTLKKAYHFGDNFEGELDKQSDAPSVQITPLLYKGVWHPIRLSVDTLELPKDAKLLSVLPLKGNSGGFRNFRLRTLRQSTQHAELSEEGQQVLDKILANEASRSEQNELKREFYIHLSDTFSSERESIDTLKDQLYGKRYTPLTVSAQPREVKVLPRGNWMDESGETVLPASPAFLPNPIASSDDQRLNRLDLAKWIVHPENPLTARTFANRIWAMYFGNALSSAPEDLGHQGEYPPYPELLDSLAAEFIQSGWDVKGLVKQIVLSKTYRQSSDASDDLYEKDPYNRLLARQSPVRLSAEIIRDNALKISGLLNPKIGGESTRPYQPAGHYRNLNFPKREYQHDTDENQYRRGIYTHWQRTFLHPMMTTFDASGRDECVVKRDLSNTPLQALTLLNDPTQVEAAKALAEILIEKKNDQHRIETAFSYALARKPSPTELETLEAFVNRERVRFENEENQSEAFLKVGLTNSSANDSPVELAALASLSRAILNLHETITRY